MFDQLKALGAITQLLRNKDALLETAERLRRELDQHRIQTEAGGGAAKVTMSGKMQIISLELDPKMISLGDDRGRRMAQQIIADAVNTAVQRAQQHLGKRISEEANAAGLPISGLEKLMGG